ncbi:sodium:proton antiporter NhaD [Hahella aquimaris]|uniref:sodium:proton antiporter NhaD n=1 Tax=Hahella sp. HNIBRBA332 TaxID=3015983 RepID=UPI00273B6958|nr:sodium:proton antiporter NhaD [Hahella sp. HNIBRBA332]WLQ12469.1 sodium:proton antiporter NhaD [Hahella sp. HNIBRBA332]
MRKLPLLLGGLLCMAGPVWASEGGMFVLDATDSPKAILAVIIFIVAYIAVMAEEVLHLRKSKPVIFAAGLIWVLVASVAQDMGRSDDEIHSAVSHNLLEYGALFLFLLVAMTFINAMEERHVFESLRSYLVHKGMSYRKLFWVTGWLAFFISPVADNLTTALLMGAVIMAVGGKDTQFVSLAMVNVVVGANAGGAFSPFGDITTLMVWASKKVQFEEFFALFIPSVLNFVTPALIMNFFLPNGVPSGHGGLVPIKRGGLRICALFLLTIATAVCFERFFHLPPFLGMMTGMSVLMFFAYFLRKTGTVEDDIQFDIFRRVARAEWDTLLFFFGVIFCVGGLATLGYLQMMSHGMYDNWGPTIANIVAGTISAVVDNIPVMFAIISMEPDMDVNQWLLITLTAGVGGSLLSIGSAAGVALMGQSKGSYTFLSHLKWSWAILIGYGVSIAAHLAINGT